MNITNQVLQQKEILSPEWLHIHSRRTVSYGAQQLWYTDKRKRLSGCGPTAASNLLWYLKATRAEICGGLYNGDGTEQSGMLRFMEEVWHDVTPGIFGMRRASSFIKGALSHAAKKDITLKARLLKVPLLVRRRPGKKEALEFLRSAFTDNLPVAFLNLSNGGVRNLDSWHWVTLVSIREDMQAMIYDQGCKKMIDLGQWLAAPGLGGAFVVLEPDK